MINISNRTVTVTDQDRYEIQVRQNLTQKKQLHFFMVGRRRKN
ncbi:hypothetical protein [uncultured Gammaproteobacteria bacterium]|nr:hypothetical protein [uncultured Gammaproteobacteria bacterium]